MRLPNADRAVIEPSKLRAYLLSAAHPQGRFKARFFLSLGYSGMNWTRLDRDLRFQHLSAPVSGIREHEFGTTYEIRAMLKGPSGQRAGLVSVWVVRRGEDFPRFVTAYPGGAR